MTDKRHVLERLLGMSPDLGKPENDYVILAEGNTSARIDSATFWVKASGARLHQIDLRSPSRCSRCDSRPTARKGWRRSRPWC
ncbi:MAG: hypothetical protein HYY04_05675 [Chloroflexi bacterium]|nr:hypothetical protein [Chloroflexota bacterium]